MIKSSISLNMLVRTELILSCLPSLIGCLLLSSLTASLGNPIIVDPPHDQTNIQGGTAIFTVSATGNPPLTYQWRAHTTVNNFTNIPGATESRLILTNVQPTSLRFSVMVSDVQSSTSSQLARLLVMLPPNIVEAPRDIAVFVGASISNSVTASGTTPLTYQWQFEGTNLLSEQGPGLRLTNVQPKNAGGYCVIITNSFGALTSSIAHLYVLQHVTKVRSDN